MYTLYLALYFVKEALNLNLVSLLSAFDPYSMIRGGIQMFVQASKGNAAQLVRCTNPLLTGAQMRVRFYPCVANNTN